MYKDQEHRCPRAGEDGANQAESKFTLSPPFVLFGPLMDSVMPVYISESDLLYTV